MQKSGAGQSLSRRSCWTQFVNCAVSSPRGPAGLRWVFLLTTGSVARRCVQEESPLSCTLGARASSLVPTGTPTLDLSFSRTQLTGPRLLEQSQPSRMRSCMGELNSEGWLPVLGTCLVFPPTLLWCSHPPPFSELWLRVGLTSTESGFFTCPSELDLSTCLPKFGFR